MPTPKTLYIRNVPPEVHRRVRGQAATMGLTLAEWVERAADRVEKYPLTSKELFTKIFYPRGKE